MRKPLGCRDAPLSLLADGLDDFLHSSLDLLPLGSLLCQLKDLHAIGDVNSIATCSIAACILIHMQKLI